MENIKIVRSELVRVMYDGGVLAGQTKIMPILDNVCITTKDNRIRIESSDSANYVRSYGICETTADMSFCVNAKEFASYIDLLNDENITINYDSEKKQLLIEHASGSVKLPTISSDEFPVMKPIKETTKIEMPGETFAGWLKKAGNFTLKSDFGAVLEGIYIYANSKFIGICGGEHSHIFTARIPNIDNIPDFSVVLPKISAAIMARMCATAKKVTLVQDENALYIRTDNTVVYSTLLSMKYPNVDSLFKQMSLRQVGIDKTALLQAIKRIESQTVKDEESLHLCCTGSVLELSYDVVSEHSKYLRESVPCEGCPFDDVIVNIKRIKNILSNYSGEKVLLYHDNSERSPFFFESRYNDSLELFLLAVMIKQ